MTLLRAFDVSLSFGSRTLFKNLELVIEEGERVGLVGVNGCGKSTLMKVLAGDQRADSVTLQLKRGARVTWLPQEPSFPEGSTPASELTVAQAQLKEALDAHHALALRLEAGEHDERLMDELSQLSERIERLGGWDTSYEAKKLLDRLDVDPDLWERPIAKLSGGQKKRIALARSLLTRPDLLMLDEPTNHLDAETVEWLEDEVDSRDSALLLVTHDRYFLDGLVDRIVEVEPYVSEAQPGGLVSYPGNYEAYLEQKYVKLEQSAQSEHKRGRWIAQEVAWLRKGLGARRTKSKARIERARKLLTERGFQRPKVPELQLAHAPRLSQTVIEANRISKGFNGVPVITDVSLIVQPGECIGFLGKNGAGKTTLLRTLLGELPPDSGTVKLGPKTKVAYYDQLRARLDDEQTVYDAAWDEEYVTLGKKRMRLAEYLDDLLFPVPMQKMKVKALSGGERNRLLLARLFLEGANVLVLDEPTNDLDLMTLNVLEKLLLDFEGAVLLVTHDRYFLDKVATALMVFEGDGKVVRHEGNYEMYRRLTAGKKPGAAPQAKAGGKGQGKSSAKPAVAQPAKPAATAPKQAPAPPKAEPAPAPAAPAAKRSKLSDLEQQELDGMAAAIAAVEQAKAAGQAQLYDPAVYADEHETRRVRLAIEAASKDVDSLYWRWRTLQAKRDE